MMTLKNIFVGCEKNPSYLVVIDKKNIIIFQPDEFSMDSNAKLDFFEKYILGKIILEIKFKNIYYKEKPKKYNILNSKIVSELIIKINENKIILNNNIIIQ
jgi:hypothetical protein